jgi:hypothetical protein
MDGLYRSPVNCNVHTDHRLSIADGRGGCHAERVA